MEFINPPKDAPANVVHRTFYSQLYDHEVGYNVYLPPEYDASGESYPTAWHIHGWTGSESSQLRAMEPIYRGRRVITVFPNSSPILEDRENLPVEAMLTTELMPLIAGEYRVDTSRERTTISGFSMGAGMAFCFAVRHIDLFSEVTAYAGTYHHYFHKGANTVGAPPEKAAELFDEMMRDKRYLEEGNVLRLVRQNEKAMREMLRIHLHIGKDDILFCDNEILHLYLESLQIPHTYKVFEGVEHELEKIL